MMSIECDGGVILRVNEHCKRRGLGPYASRRCVGEKRAAEPLTLESQIDREAANADCRQQRIARQLLGDDLRQIGRRDARRRNCVKPGDDPRFDFDCDETIADVTAHILGDLVLEIPVERLRPAGETLALVVGEQFDEEGRLQASRSSARRR